ncbi:XRE family transcriptional regulator [Agrobacterium sp. BA1120]|uniref:XRE family transcriptional regulator n=1 Tax=Agrobacterium sp. BA1120 TaxID=3228927 RepID=UPI003369C39C
MSDYSQITGRQIAAARALLGLDQAGLAGASDISEDALRAIEAKHETMKDDSDDLRAVVSALQSAGISFIDDNQTSSAGGPGVRLLKSPGEFDTDQSQTVQYPEHLAPDAPTGAGG